LSAASEIFLTAGAAAVGVAAGSLGVYLYSRGSPKTRAESVTPEKPESATSTSEKSQGDTENSSTITIREQTRTIPKVDLENSKRELRTLLLEKELVSAALTRLYEAEAAKEITKPEREILGAKYVAELKSLDDKITKMDAFIQIGDLETLRNQLLQLVEQKIDSIERRIESTRKLAEPLVAEMLKKQQQLPAIAVSPSIDETQRGTPIPDISDMLQNEKPQPRIDPTAEQPQVALAPAVAKIEPQKTAPATVVVDRKRPADKVEELQKEILEALDRLERLDVDSP
jgi:hypothetical protein